MHFLRAQTDTGEMQTHHINDKLGGDKSRARFKRNSGANEIWENEVFNRHRADENARHYSVVSWQRRSNHLRFNDEEMEFQFKGRHIVLHLMADEWQNQIDIITIFSLFLLDFPDLKLHQPSKKV